MTVYVDEIQRWPHARPPFHQGSCHLTADSLDELHAFAVRIGLQRSWFQNHPLAPHYDLTPSRRHRALMAGATFVSAREQAKARIELRQRRKFSTCFVGNNLTDVPPPSKDHHDD